MRDGNAHHGDVIAVDTRNSYAYARRLVALVGVDDLVVVETDDAVLVAHKDRVQQVKEMVAQLKDAQRSQAACIAKCTARGAATTRSTWATRFQVKRIKVKPGARCRCSRIRIAPSTGSSSRHRAGHLRRRRVRPARTRAPTSPSARSIAWKIPARRWLELIEVQSGDYLGEDDIVRYSDIYGRSG